jgi:hypothetical protein
MGEQYPVAGIRSDLGLRWSQRVVVAMVVGRPPSYDQVAGSMARHVGLLATPLIAVGIDPPVSSREVAPNNSTVAYSQRARDRPVIGAGSASALAGMGRSCAARPDEGGVGGTRGRHRRSTIAPRRRPRWAVLVGSGPVLAARWGGEARSRRRGRRAGRCIAAHRRWRGPAAGRCAAPTPTLRWPADRPGLAARTARRSDLGPPVGCLGRHCCIPGNRIEAARLPL